MKGESGSGMDGGGPSSPKQNQGWTYRPASVWEFVEPKIAW